MGNQVVVNNLLINYIRVGPQKPEKTLVFLHGWRSDSQVWLAIVGHLEDSGLAIYVLYLPGFGNSQTPGKPFGVGDYAEVVAGFMEKLDIKHAILTGHSFGGRVAIKLAGSRPGSIERLVLVDSAGFADSGKKKSAMSAAAKVVKLLFKPEFMQGLRKKIYQKIGLEDYVATPGMMTKIYVKVIGEDLTEDMKRIVCPTLIIYGSDDMVTPPEFGGKMARLIAGSKLVILSQAGHFSFLDQPEEFAKVFRQFIGA